MTLSLGLKTADSVVLIADSRGTMVNGFTIDSVRKIHQVGKNCAIAIAGSGDVAMTVLNASDVESSTVLDPRKHAQRIANAYRAYMLGVTDPAHWWSREYDRIANLGKDWVSHAPQLETIIAGYDNTGPYICNVVQNEGFSTPEPLNGLCIAGQITVGLWMLQTFIPSDFWSASTESALFAGALALLITSEFHPAHVNFKPSMCVVDESGVSFLSEDAVVMHCDRARQVHSGWKDIFASSWESLTNNSATQDP